MQVLVVHVAVLLIGRGVTLSGLVVGHVLHRALVVQDETLETNRHSLLRHWRQTDTIHTDTGDKQTQFT